MYYYADENIEPAHNVANSSNGQILRSTTAEINKENQIEGKIIQETLLH